MSDNTPAFTTINEIASTLGIKLTRALSLYDESTLPFPKKKIKDGTALTEREAANVLAHLSVNVSEMLPRLQERVEERTGVSLKQVNDIMRDLERIRELVRELNSGPIYTGAKYKKFAAGVMELLDVEKEKIPVLAETIKDVWERRMSIEEDDECEYL